MVVAEKINVPVTRSMGIDASMSKLVEEQEPSIYGLFRHFRDWVDHSPNHWRIDFQGQTKYHLRVANTPELRAQAFRFGQERYQTAHYSSGDAQMLCSRFDAHPDTLTLLIFDENDHCIGTSTVIKDHPDIGLPVDDTFGEEADLLRICGKRMAEVVRLAIDPAIPGRMSREILIHLLNFAYIHATHTLGCDGFLITVNPKHVAYYERALGYKRVSVVRPCPKVQNAPAALLYLCFSYACARVASEAGRAPMREKKGALYPFLYTREIEPLIASYLLRHHRPMEKEEAVALGLLS